MCEDKGFSYPYSSFDITKAKWRRKANIFSQSSTPGATSITRGWNQRDIQTLIHSTVFFTPRKSVRDQHFSFKMFTFEVVYFRECYFGDLSGMCAFEWCSIFNDWWLFRAKLLAWLAFHMFSFLKSWRTNIVRKHVFLTL